MDRFWCPWAKSCPFSGDSAGSLKFVAAGHDLIHFVDDVRFFAFCLSSVDELMSIFMLVALRSIGCIKKRPDPTSFRPFHGHDPFLIHLCPLPALVFVVGSQILR